MSWQFGRLRVWLAGSLCASYSHALLFSFALFCTAALSLPQLPLHHTTQYSIAQTEHTVHTEQEQEQYKQHIPSPSLPISCPSETPKGVST